MPRKPASSALLLARAAGDDWRLPGHFLTRSFAVLELLFPLRARRRSDICPLVAVMAAHKLDAMHMAETTKANGRTVTILYIHMCG